jgi:threonine synthase
VYYFYAYFRFLDLTEVPKGQWPSVNFAVPTGNFGNALAGFYARGAIGCACRAVGPVGPDHLLWGTPPAMGLPIDKLVVATNHNDILARFFQQSDYSTRPVRPSLGMARSNSGDWVDGRAARSTTRIHADAVGGFGSASHGHCGAFQL